MRYPAIRMAILRFHVEPRTDGLLRVSAGRISGAFVQATLRPDLVPPPVDLASGAQPADDVLTRGEEARGRALARALLDQGFAYPLASLIADHPPASGRSVVLVQDEGSDLPWELLAAHGDAAPLESVGAGLVARLAPGPPPLAHPACRRWRLLVSCPTPEEPVCARLSASVRQRALDAGAFAALSAPDAGPAAADTATVLVLIGHGRLGVDGLMALIGPDGPRHGASQAHALATELRDAWLTLALVCDAAAAGPLEDVGQRLVAAGAAVCVAPARPLPVSVAEQVATTAFRCVADGEPLVSTLWRCRAAVRERGLPWFRWHDLRVLVSGAEVLERAGALPDSQVEGWPGGSAAASTVMRTALHHARQQGHGYLGLEHIVRGFAEHAPAGPASSRLCQAVRRARPVPASRVLAVVASASGTPKPTPRVRALGLGLSPGFDVESLAAAVQAVWPPALALVTGIALDQSSAGAHPAATEPVTDTVQPPPAAVDAASHMASASSTAPAAVAVELIGGPEDGRQVVLSEGDWLGRAPADGRPAATQIVYEDTVVQDRGLSHQHLCWCGSGRVELAGSARRWNGRELSRLEPGEYPLAVGAVWRLGGSTWIVGCGPE